MLQAGEGFVGSKEGLDGGVVFVGFVGLLGGVVPEIGAGAAEAAEGPLARDEFIDQEARFPGKRACGDRSVRL